MFLAPFLCYNLTFTTTFTPFILLFLFFFSLPKHNRKNIYFVLNHKEGELCNMFWLCCTCCLKSEYRKKQREQQISLEHTVTLVKINVQIKQKVFCFSFPRKCIIYCFPITTVIHVWRILWNGMNINYQIIDSIVLYYIYIFCFVSVLEEKIEEISNFAEIWIYKS